MVEFDKFRADHKGICVSCHKEKPLDSMIKETDKGYSCVDCVVEDESQNLEYAQQDRNFKGADFENLHLKPMTTEFKIISENKFNKIMKWCLG